MKYMLIMRGTDETTAAFQDADFNEILETMWKFTDELISAGVLVAAEGLDADVNATRAADYCSRPPACTTPCSSPTRRTRRWRPTDPTARPRSCSVASGSSTSPPRRRRSSGP